MNIEQYWREESSLLSCLSVIRFLLQVMMGLLVLRELPQQILLLLFFGFHVRKFPKIASSHTSCSCRGGKVSFMSLWFEKRSGFSFAFFCFVFEGICLVIEKVEKGSTKRRKSNRFQAALFKSSLDRRIQVFRGWYYYYIHMHVCMYLCMYACMN